jgi:hypothetical protein
VQSIADFGVGFALSTTHSNASLQRLQLQIYPVSFANFACGLCLTVSISLTFHFKFSAATFLFQPSVISTIAFPDLISRFTFRTLDAVFQNAHVHLKFLFLFQHP